MLTKVFPGNVAKKEFLAKNPQLLEYFNGLSEEDQKSNARRMFSRYYEHYDNV